MRKAPVRPDPRPYLREEDRTEEEAPESWITFHNHFCWSATMPFGRDAVALILAGYTAYKSPPAQKKSQRSCHFNKSTGSSIFIYNTRSNPKYSDARLSSSAYNPIAAPCAQTRDKRSAAACHRVYGHSQPQSDRCGCSPDRFSSRF